MAIPEGGSKAARETVLYPFSAFSFAVEIRVEGVEALKGLVCSAAFSECDGLEMTREVKTVREGGNNGVQIRLAGPLSYAQLSLKRGMTDSYDLWLWFEACLRDPSLRAETDVLLLSPAGGEPRATFRLSRCLPVKVKAPALNAKDGAVAIEELGLAYESLRLVPKGAP